MARHLSCGVSSSHSTGPRRSLSLPPTVFHCLLWKACTHRFGGLRMFGSQVIGIPFIRRALFQGPSNCCVAGQSCAVGCNRSLAAQVEFSFSFVGVERRVLFPKTQHRSRLPPRLPGSSDPKFTEAIQCLGGCNVINACQRHMSSIGALFWHLYSFILIFFILFLIFPPTSWPCEHQVRTSISKCQHTNPHIIILHKIICRSIFNVLTNPPG